MSLNDSLFPSTTTLYQILKDKTNHALAKQLNTIITEALKAAENGYSYYETQATLTEDQELYLKRELLAVTKRMIHGKVFTRITWGP